MHGTRVHTDVCIALVSVIKQGTRRARPAGNDACGHGLTVSLLPAGTLIRSAISGPLGPEPFWAILKYVLLSELLASALPVLADSAVLVALRDRKCFGRMRMWGAAGWGLMAMLAGHAISR